MEQSSRGQHTAAAGRVSEATRVNYQRRTIMTEGVGLRQREKQLNNTTGQKISVFSKIEVKG